MQQGTSSKSRYTTIDSVTLTGTKSTPEADRNPNLKFGFFDSKPRFSIYKNLVKPITNEDFKANIINFPIDANALSILVTAGTKLAESKEDSEFSITSEETVFDEVTRQPTDVKRHLGKLVFAKKKGKISLTVLANDGFELTFDFKQPYRNKFYAKGALITDAEISVLYFTGWLKDISRVNSLKQFEGAYRG